MLDDNPTPTAPPRNTEALGSRRCRWRRGIGLALALAVLAAAPSAARPGWKLHRLLPAFSNVWKLAVGTAADYDVQSPCGSSSIELAVVGKDSLDGKDGYWTEISAHPTVTRNATLGREGEMVFKAFFHPDSKGVLFTRMIAQGPKNEPIEFPEAFDYLALDYLRIAAGYRLHYRHPQAYYYDSKEFYPWVVAESEAKAELPKADDLGPETVTTAAGLFACEHFRYEHNSGDVWVSREAAPFGLVKAVTKDHTTMTLTRLLTNARDKITAAPRAFQARRDADFIDSITYEKGGYQQFWRSDAWLSGLWDIINCRVQPLG
jgi:hypothetical protein